MDITKNILYTMPLSTEVVTDINGVLSDYLPLSGGIVSGDIEIYQADLNILSGNIIQTTENVNKIFSPKNALLQAEAAYSGSGKVYSMSYCGTKGFCIESVIISVDPNDNSTVPISCLGLKLSGDMTVLRDAFYNDIYAGKVITDYEPFDANYPTNSTALNEYVWPTKSKDPHLSALKWSISLDNIAQTVFSTISALDVENNIVWLSTTYNDLSNNLIYIDDNKTAIRKASLSTTDQLTELYLNDDNAFYVPGFPELGNQLINNFYGNTAFGGGSRAIGKYTIVQGRDGIADERYSHAEGTHCFAGGLASHAEGYKTGSIGKYSHAGGNASKAIGYMSFVHGKQCEAKGDSSIALGNKAKVEHHNSFTWNGLTTDYTSNREGSFNVNPKDGLNGFFINDNNFIECVLSAIKSMSSTQKQQLYSALTAN